MPDRWQSMPVVCKGGLVLDTGALIQGTTLEGTARILQNYEPALEGGYKRILGFTKWDTNAVTGATGEPIRGVHAALGGVFAARENVAGTSTDILFSSGSGWTKINTAGQAVATGKVRFNSFAISGEVVVVTDGQGPALHWDGTTDTLINGTGAPTAPKFAVEHLNRLVLAPASNDSSIAISAADNETNFDGVDGAIEINVGDKVMGLQEFRDELYIFCENSIHKLQGQTSQNFVVVAVTDSIGTLSGDTIQELGGDIIFLAPDGLRSLAATQRLGDVDLALQSRQIQPEIRSRIGQFTEDDYSSNVVRAKSQYRLFINEDNLSENDQVGFLGKVGNSLQGNLGYEWSTLRGIWAFCTHSTYDGDDEVVVHGHPTDGYVYRQEVGNTFGLDSGAVNITANYTTPDLTFENTDIRKVLQKMKLHTQAEGNVDFNVGVSIDFGGTNIPQPTPINVSQSGGAAVYGGAVYGTDSYSVVQFTVFKINLIGSGFTFAFSFTSSNSNPPHRIDSYSIQFGPKARR